MRIFHRLTLIFLRLRELRAHGRARHPGAARAPGFRGMGFRGMGLRASGLGASSWRAVSWAALATALAGCDGNDSVVHRARLDAKPDMQCMKRAVEGVSGVSNVVYLHAAAQDRPDFDEIAYDADDQRVMLMVAPDREYSQTFLRMGGFGADGIAPRIRRVMASVDRAVEKVCHVRNLTRRVRETCGEGAHPEGKCPPFAS